MVVPVVEGRARVGVRRALAGAMAQGVLGGRDGHRAGKAGGAVGPSQSDADTARTVPRAATPAGAPSRKRGSQIRQQQGDPEFGARGSGTPAPNFLFSGRVLATYCLGEGLVSWFSDLVK